jgi:hypothetical protein
MTIDEMIKATKLCTKALMRLSYVNFLIKDGQKIHRNEISDKNINLNNY